MLRLGTNFFPTVIQESKSTEVNNNAPNEGVLIEAVQSLENLSTFLKMNNVNTLDDEGTGLLSHALFYASFSETRDFDPVILELLRREINQKGTDRDDLPNRLKKWKCASQGPIIKGEKIEEISAILKCFTETVRMDEERHTKGMLFVDCLTQQTLVVFLGADDLGHARVGIAKKLVALSNLIAQHNVMDWPSEERKNLFIAMGQYLPHYSTISQGFKQLTNEEIDNTSANFARFLENVTALPQGLQKIPQKELFRFLIDASAHDRLTQYGLLKESDSTLMLSLLFEKTVDDSVGCQEEYANKMVAAYTYALEKDVTLKDFSFSHIEDINKILTGEKTERVDFHGYGLVGSTQAGREEIITDLLDNKDLPGIVEIYFNKTRDSSSGFSYENYQDKRSTKKTDATALTNFDQEWDAGKQAYMLINDLKKSGARQRWIETLIQDFKKMADKEDCKPEDLLRAAIKIGKHIDSLHFFREANCRTGFFVMQLLNRLTGGHLTTIDDLNFLESNSVEELLEQALLCQEKLKTQAHL